MISGQMATNAEAETQYAAAEAWINGLILGPPSPPPGTPPEEIRRRAIERLVRLRAFLAFIGNPHQQYRTVHVTGTSGKGSTSTTIAALLTAAGFRTGLHVSPYLQVATEKLQINNRLIAVDRYAQLVEDMRASVEAWVAAGNERPNYGEVWVALTYRWFAEEEVDVAVIEVGAGGRFDVTNVIDAEVAVITSVGLDHTATLGKTLPEIAWHKAGIISPGARVISGVRDAGAREVIAAEVALQQATLTEILPPHDVAVVRTEPGRTLARLLPEGLNLDIPLSGRFQAHNAALAIHAARAFAPECMTSDVIASGLAQVRFPGRLEQVQSHPTVVLDGAHNPDKIGSLAASLREVYGQRRIVLVFGVLESKNYRDMLTALLPLVDAVVTTAPRVLAKPAVEAVDIAAIVTDLPVVAVDMPLDAVDAALAQAGPDDLVLVSGSLYLVGNVRERWFPTAAILQQGTSWPSTRA